MVGLNGVFIESTAQLAPAYAGLVLCLLVSALGIVCATSLPRIIRIAIERRIRRRPTFANKGGRRAGGHFQPHG